MPNDYINRKAAIEEIKTDNAFLQVADEFHMNDVERFVLAGIVMIGSVDFDSEEWIAFSKFIGEEESAKYTNAITRLVELGYAKEESNG